VVEAGLKFAAANFWARGRRAGHVEFGALGAVFTPFPYALIYPQDEHERFLIERLSELGVQVERGEELLDFEEKSDGVVAHLRGSTCSAAFLAGCDGAHSIVRERLGIIPDEMDSGHLPALAHPKELAGRLDAYVQASRPAR